MSNRAKSKTMFLGFENQNLVRVCLSCSFGRCIHIQPNTFWALLPPIWEIRSSREVWVFNPFDVNRSKEVCVFSQFRRFVSKNLELKCGLPTHKGWRSLCTFSPCWGRNTTVTKIYDFCNVDAGKYNFSYGEINSQQSVGSTVTSSVYRAAPFVIRFQNREQVLPSSERLCNVLCTYNLGVTWFFVSYPNCKKIGI